MGKTSSSIRQLIAFGFIAVGASFWLSSCNPQPPNSDNVQSPTTTDQDTLKLLYWQAPTILNPHLSTGFKDAEASRITLEPLASFDENSELVPFLAAEIPTVENGGIAKDGKSVTWKLKQDIKWSDGQSFTAKDVAFTFDFISDPTTGSTTAGTYEVVEKVEVIDDHTVKIHFKNVNPAWFLVFVGGEGMILPHHIYESYIGEKAREAPANLQPIGTGPYQVVEFKPGDVVVYEPNPNFREADTLGFKRIELKGGGDATSAARAVLQTGDADFAYNLQIEAPVLKQLETGGKGQIVSVFAALMERILINQSDPTQMTAEGERSSLKNPHPFLNDPLVRQAFSLAIDRDTVAEQLYGVTGKATPNFLVLPEQFYSQNTTYEVNLTKANQLLEQAGWTDSNNNGTRDKDGVEMEIVFQTSINPVRQKTQEIVKQGLQSIGVGVELKSVDATIFFSSDPSNDDTIEKFYADLQMFTTGNTSPDPSTYLKGYTCNTVPQKANNWSGNNYSRYCNPEYDQLWQQFSMELDSQKRQDLAIQMNDLLVKDFIVIPLVHRAEVVGISNQLQGFALTPWDRNTWNIAQWKKTQ
ncbi:MAG: peptide ABC transporter substrate-binding protein [Microcystaceae cyanobacterium]